MRVPEGEFFKGAKQNVEWESGGSPQEIFEKEGNILVKKSIFVTASFLGLATDCMFLWPDQTVPLM